MVGVQKQEEACADKLGALGPAAKEAMPALSEALRTTKRSELRRSALTAMSKIDSTNDDTREHIAAALKHSDGHLQIAAAAALLRSGADASKAISTLCSAMSDNPSGRVKQQAAEVLGQFPVAAKPAIPNLIALLKSNGPRHSAAKALGMIGPNASAATEPLAAALKDHDKDVRSAAAIALGQIGPRAAAAVPALAGAVPDRDKSVTIAAIEALEAMGSKAKPGIPALLKVLKDPHFGDAARKALMAISPSALKSR